MLTVKKKIVDSNFGLNSTTIFGQTLAEVGRNIFKPVEFLPNHGANFG
jgi:hypothetical protein